jgi:hypothetical protein
MYGSWSWKFCNPITTWKKGAERSKVVEEKRIVGSSIPIGLGEEMWLTTNKGRPWTVEFGLEQPLGMKDKGF